MFLDTGYRTVSKLGQALDTLIEKTEEVEESEIYSNKDLADLYALAHKMRMDVYAFKSIEKGKSVTDKNTK